MKLYDAFKDLRDKFEIVAFHDASAKTFEELDRKLARTVKTAWKGRQLPFPVILDATGKTVRAYGVRAFPTILLVDPQGKLVQGGGEKLLEQKLLELRKSKKPEVTRSAK